MRVRARSAGSASDSDSVSIHVGVGILLRHGHPRSRASTIVACLTASAPITAAKEAGEDKQENAVQLRHPYQEHPVNIRIRPLCMLEAPNPEHRGRVRGGRFGETRSRAS